MKLIAISILVLAGAIMAAAGTIAESMPDAKRFSVVDEWGIGVVVIGGLLLITELFQWRPFSASSTSTSRVTADMPFDA
jgi:TRAP-type C4-dicarboxylate transport system permease large subunit